MVKWLTQFALYLCIGSREFAVMLISCIPLIELKGAIPIGVEYYSLSPSASFWLAFAGSSLVCIPLMLAFRPIHKWAKKRPNSLTARIENVFRKKANGLCSRKSRLYKMLGIFIFAAVPLPLTGVWTASIISVLIGLEFFSAFLAIILGNLLSGTLILLLTQLLGAHINLFLYVLLAFALVFFAVFVYKVFRQTTREEITKGDFNET